jgi:hypothetical protein
MGTFLANIQVFSEGNDASKLLDKLENAITDRLINGVYEIAEDANSADRSIILKVSSDRWISVYDQKLDEQDINAMDTIGTTISQLGIPTLGSLVHDSDLLMLRLYRSGGTANTIVNDLDIFNEMMEGKRPRKRNGLPMKWAEVCGPGVDPAELKEIWENNWVFADEALLRAAELLAIPSAAVFRGDEIDLTFQQNSVENEQLRVLHFRSIIRRFDSLEFTLSDGPKLEFASWDASAVGEVGVPSKVMCGLNNRGLAFAPLDVLLWGPAIDEGIIVPYAGTMFRISSESHTREAWSCNPQPHNFVVIQMGDNLGKSVSGYLYQFPQIAFPEGFMQGMYQADAVRRGLMKQWMKEMQNAIHSFQLVFTGRRVGQSHLSIAFIPTEFPEDQLGWSLPVYIGVEPKSIT